MAKSDRRIRAQMVTRLRDWFDLSNAAREAKRQAERTRFDWRLPGAHVIPWTERQRRAMRRR